MIGSLVYIVSCLIANTATEKFSNIRLMLFFGILFIGYSMLLYAPDEEFTGIPMEKWAPFIG